MQLPLKLKIHLKQCVTPFLRRKSSTLMTKPAQTVNHGSTITVDNHGKITL